MQAWVKSNRDRDCGPDHVMRLGICVLILILILQIIRDTNNTCTPSERWVICFAFTRSEPVLAWTTGTAEGTDVGDRMTDFMFMFGGCKLLRQG